MAKNPEIIENGAGEQLYLMDIHTETAKKVLAIGKKYNIAVKRRQKEQRVEVELKTEIRELVRKLNYTPLPDGSMKLSLEGTEVTVTPKEEKVTIKFKDE